MVKIVLKDLKKSYGNVVACDIDFLEIKDKEFFTFLGPSGSGKTTTLRIIAGFIEPDAGEIYIDDKLITGIPPEKRNMAMVFQSYALFPHMNVFDNVAFGLTLKKLPKEEIKKKVKNALELVRLSGLEDRYPRQLSGGQQQRVAVARAIVMEPDVLLFDEPLSNLDAKLREAVRFELRELQKKLGITSIYVTHDQAEALVISDRIAVMNEGKIIQVGSPIEIYEKPESKFIADFIGISSFIEGKIIDIDEEGLAILESEDGIKIKAICGKAEKGVKAFLALRPEYVEIFPAKERSGINVFEGEIKRLAYLGDTIDYRVSLGKWEIRVRDVPTRIFKPGEKVGLWLNPKKCVLITH
ncbi:ABC transporter ATP-binding protein [Candidatus Bathyarchaeota archaeon]|nr:ABC transporter ATP-binding protein [Candidatus Bathyarchaeota archaeon]